MLGYWHETSVGHREFGRSLVCRAMVARYAQYLESKADLDGASREYKKDR